MSFTPTPNSWFVSQTHPDHPCLPVSISADPFAWNNFARNFNANLIFDNYLCSIIIFAKRNTMLTISKFSLFILLLLQNILPLTLPYFSLWHFLVSEIKWFVLIISFIYYLSFLLIHLQKKAGASFCCHLLLLYHIKDSRWQNKRMCTHLFPQEHQNLN